MSKLKKVSESCFNFLLLRLLFILRLLSRPSFQIFPSLLELKFKDPSSEFKTLMFSNAHNSSVCFFFLFLSVFHLIFYQNVHLMLGVLPFFALFSLLELGLFHWSLDGGTLVCTVPACTVILAKLFAAFCSSWTFFCRNSLVKMFPFLVGLGLLVFVGFLLEIKPL